MKILQVGKFYPPYQGGIETVTKTLAEELVKSGVEVTVLCASSTSSGSEERLQNVDIIRTPYYGSVFSQPICPGYALQLTRLARNFDLLHFHSPHPLAEAAGLSLPRNIPQIVSYHADVVRQKYLLPFYRPMLHRFLSRADKIVAATEFHLRSQILGPFAYKTEVIPFGLDPSQLKWTPEVEREVAGLREKYGRFALFVGRLVGYKGLPVLLEAMQSLSTQLVIVGDGPLRSQLEEKTRQLGLAERVHFQGYIKESPLFSAFFHASDFLVLPSISPTEAFGMVQLEAMACHKPCITSKLESGVSQVTEPGVSGIQVPPEDPEALARAMKELATNDLLLAKMGSAAFVRFEKLFTAKQMAARYLDLYERVLGKTSTKTAPLGKVG